MTMKGFVLWTLLLSTSSSQNVTVGNKYLTNCGKGKPCLFLGKDVGWEEFNDSPSHALAPPPISDSWQSNETTIFLSIASYRDDLCPNTLYNIFTKAANPNRVFIGLLQQNFEKDIDCVKEYCKMMQKETKFSSTQCPFINNIRGKIISADEAKGPTYARAIASQFLQDEEFCMQTDSHMDFVPAWDFKMLRMWGWTNNEYAVLSTYVYDSTTLPHHLDGQLGLNNAFEAPNLCMVVLNGCWGMVRNWGAKCMRFMPKPKLTNIVWGAGLSFSKCHAERKATYDPHTPHIFDGEEYSRGLRFWTWGYDIYSPNRVYVVHNYFDSQANKDHMLWAVKRNKTEQVWLKRNMEVVKSVRRLKMLFGMPHQNANPEETLKLQQSRYGLGDRRSLAQAIEFSGIDTVNRKIVGNKCGNLDYVPFKEHPWGPNYIPKYDPISEEFKDVRDPGSIYYNPTTMEKDWQEADKKRKKTLNSKQERSFEGNKRDNREKGTSIIPLLVFISSFFVSGFLLLRICGCSFNKVFGKPRSKAFL